MSEGSDSGTPGGPRSWEEELVEGVPGLARIGAGVAWRTARWSAGTYASLAGRALRTAGSGESAAELIEEAGEELRRRAREALELAGLDQRRAEAEAEAIGARPGGVEAGPAPAAQRPDRPRAAEPAPRPRGRRGAESADPEALRAKGAALLARSMLPETDQPEVHPAYSRILDLLSPDEARILRLLAAAGPQPTVDVRTWRPLGIGSEQTGTGLSMIDEEAGCRYPEQVPAYLNNLFRLGLIWFSHEKLRDPAAYQVVEAQPPVMEAIERAGGRATIVRRSIQLTPFGTDFCATCIPPPGEYMELGITTGGGASLEK